MSNDSVKFKSIQGLCLPIITSKDI